MKSKNWMKLMKRLRWCPHSSISNLTWKFSRVQVFEVGFKKS